MQKPLHPNVNGEDCNLIKCCNRGGCEWGFSFPFLWKKNPVFEDDEDSENERLGSSTLPNPPEMATHWSFSLLVDTTATDLDEGINGEIVYSFIERGNFNPEDVFSLNPDTGEITVKGKVDYEENTAYDIRVQARDKGTPSRSVHGKVLVEVTDINDNIPEIITTSLMSPVKEDAEVGTVVALVTVNDKDGGNNGLTSAKILGLVPFKLKLNYKNYYSLTVNGPLDRESVSQYNVTIMATDEGTPPLSSTSVIPVHISDVNDNAPLFSEPVVNVYLKENSAVGATIFAITAVDPDIEENATQCKHTSCTYALKIVFCTELCNLEHSWGLEQSVCWSINKKVRENLKCIITL